MTDDRMPGGMRNAKRRNGDGNPACPRHAEASRELHVTTAGERGPPEKDLTHRHLAGGLPV